FSACGSTSDEAWLAIEQDNAPDGSVFLAEEQSSARGRMGRSWHAPAGVGLYLSLVLRMKIPPERVSYVTSCAALAVASTIEQFVHLPAEIKWPNDILIGGRKVAGILVESRSNFPDTYVVGIGLNVNHRSEDFPKAIAETATSLRHERGGKHVHRIRLIRPLLFYLDSVFAQLRKKKFERIAAAWKEFVNIEGKRVLLRAKGEDISGTLESIDLEKGVTVLLDAGLTRTYRPEHVASIREAEESA
ncbi:MAG: biotin--[acetyl-CoA-carboxylase] ligase, partial [Planctomycetes bacterium]|nr:biotin--[acetyl-CoA-carboxylase] ligase [Planctomycetota bacterium]